MVHSRLVMGKSLAKNIDGKAKLITIHPSSSAALLDVNIPSQLTRKAQALGHMHSEEQDFWGALFQFQAPQRGDCWTKGQNYATNHGR